MDALLEAHLTLLSTYVETEYVKTLLLPDVLDDERQYRRGRIDSLLWTQELLDTMRNGCGLDCAECHMAENDECPYK